MKGCKPDSVKHMHDKDVANGRMPVEGRYTVIGSGPDCKSGTFGFCWFKSSSSHERCVDLFLFANDSAINGSETRGPIDSRKWRLRRKLMKLRPCTKQGGFILGSKLIW